MSGSPDVQKIQERVYPTLLMGLTVLCKEKKKPIQRDQKKENLLFTSRKYKLKAFLPEILAGTIGIGVLQYVSCIVSFIC